jgi:hypothetical protein
LIQGQQLIDVNLDLARFNTTFEFRRIFSNLSNIVHYQGPFLQPMQTQTSVPPDGGR